MQNKYFFSGMAPLESSTNLTQGQRISNFAFNTQNLYQYMIYIINEKEFRQNIPKEKSMPRYFICAIINCMICTTMFALKDFDLNSKPSCLTNVNANAPMSANFQNCFQKDRQSLQWWPKLENIASEIEGVRQTRVFRTL